MNIQKIVYPRPGKVGGQLIRGVIGFLRAQEVSLPLTTDILIAVSGGRDSVALAHLLVHYGRRIVPKSRIRLLHVNHRWRGVDSDQDADFVKNLGHKWGVPVLVHSVAPPGKKRKSWEEDAREKRKAVFEAEAEKAQGLVFTAHQADDLVETLLWRLFTGASQTHGAGIFCRSGFEVRPFLFARKKQLDDYLKECGQEFREDSTNQSDRFLRAQMRQNLLPAIEKLFPRAAEHLIKAGLAAQEIQKTQATENQLQEPEYRLLRDGLFRAAGLKVRRSQWELILQKGVANRGWSGEIHLPEGWKLSCLPVKGKTSKKWILEKI